MSSWQSEKLAWGASQAEIGQNRLGDCSLKCKILHMAFPVPPTATRLHTPLPSQKTLASSVCVQSGLPQAALLTLQPLLLSLQVSASRSLPREASPRFRLVTAHSPVHIRATRPVLWTALCITRERGDPCFWTVLHYLAEPGSGRVLKPARGLPPLPSLPCFHPCLLSLCVLSLPPPPPLTTGSKTALERTVLTAIRMGPHPGSRGRGTETSAAPNGKCSSP